MQVCPIAGFIWEMFNSTHALKNIRSPGNFRSGLKFMPKDNSRSTDNFRSTGNFRSDLDFRSMDNLYVKGLL